MKLVNLTPHNITLIQGTAHCDVVSRHWILDSETWRVEIPAAGVVARVTTQETEDGTINGIPLYATKFGEITGLPESAPDTLYIVSAVVLTAAKAVGRTDCVCVTHTIFGDDHKVIGAMGLSH